ncbi:MAG: UDP-N-acetylglucosamine 2-epimerase (non-hydrolyzing) [candidate division Zixibacteria bacterium]|nr:UDP-N-acetylglucosamine 2-epimerase (non-hydrolyzing) [candidate division Zixibacteria bacterium]
MSLPTSSFAAHKSETKVLGPWQILLVAGARPNFVKLAPLYNELSRRNSIFDPIIMHTGQHYDRKMSDIFFEELDIPTPQINLGVGSGSHATQTAKIMIETERVLMERKPDLVVVFGDVNSTMAATIAATKLGIPVAHVEAGLRSFDRNMPEEINRLVTDVLADLLLTPSSDADRNLLNEGIAPQKIVMVGNIMIDTLVKFASKADESKILDKLGVESKKFVLLTMHRPGNVDNSESVSALIEIIESLSKDYKIVFPAHPRTRRNLKELGPRARRIVGGELKNLIITEPLGYLDFLKLQKESAVTLTDSGGVQEETTYLGTPCLTLRPNTERPITISHGTNHLLGLNPKSAIDHARRFMENTKFESRRPPMWDGKTSGRIADAMERFLSSRSIEKQSAPVRKNIRTAAM